MIIYWKVKLNLLQYSNSSNILKLIFTYKENYATVGFDSITFRYQFHADTIFIEYCVYYFHWKYQGQITGCTIY